MFQDLNLKIPRFWDMTIWAQIRPHDSFSPKSFSFVCTIFHELNSKTLFVFIQLNFNTANLQFFNASSNFCVNRRILCRKGRMPFRGSKSTHWKYLRRWARLLVYELVALNAMVSTLMFKCFSLAVWIVGHGLPSPYFFLLCYPCIGWL